MGTLGHLLLACGSLSFLQHWKTFFANPGCVFPLLQAVRALGRKWISLQNHNTVVEAKGASSHGLPRDSTVITPKEKGLLGQFPHTHIHVPMDWDEKWD